MAFSAGSTSSQSSEINVTPLIDVLLVLLIIFMVIVPIAPRGLDSSIPQSKATTAAALGPVTVQILGSDPTLPALYRIDGRMVAAAELQPLLRSMFAVRQSRTLFVEADRGLSYQQVAAVVGEGRAAGAEQVSLQPATAAR
jgi:biopolymer transport protein ExbD